MLYHDAPEDNQSNSKFLPVFLLILFHPAIYFQAIILSTFRVGLSKIQIPTSYCHLWTHLQWLHCGQYKNLIDKDYGKIQHLHFQCYIRKIFFQKFLRQRPKPLPLSICLIHMYSIIHAFMHINKWSFISNLTLII